MRTGRRLARKRKTTPRVEVKGLSDKDLKYLRENIEKELFSNISPKSCVIRFNS